MTVKDLLLKARLGESEVDIPGVGTVRVRALSRAEVLGLRGLSTVEFEQALLTAGLVDPDLTADEVAQWYANAPYDEFEPVLAAVIQMSGMAPTSAKATYKELASDPDAEFRDVPGAATGDDGGPAAAGDE